jgi:hypothetical protein
MENDLMQKLVKSKAIMDRHNNIDRGKVDEDSLANYNIPNAKYNIPDNIIQENEMAMTNIKIHETPSSDAIKNSKLPDEIKRIMMEHPIVQSSPQITKNVLTDSMIEKASKLMGNKPKQNIAEQKHTSNIQIDAEYIKNIVKETVKSTIKEMGLLTESTEKSDEFFQFKVGTHIFEGKIHKIKKIKS